jgi:hypothetical protein
MKTPASPFEWREERRLPWLLLKKKRRRSWDEREMRRMSWDDEEEIKDGPAFAR